MEEEEKNTECLTDNIKEIVEDKLKQFTIEDLNANNLDILYKLVDIHKDIENEEYWKEKKEVMKMRYRGEYDERYMDDRYSERDYDNYGNSRSYGRRQRDSRGRYMDYDDDKEELLEDMHEFYHKYAAGRDGRYGADSTKSLKYMLESAKEFMKKISQDAQTQEEMEMVRRAVQEMNNEMM